MVLPAPARAAARALRLHGEDRRQPEERGARPRRRGPAARAAHLLDPRAAPGQGRGAAGGDLPRGGAPHAARAPRQARQRRRASRRDRLRGGHHLPAVAGADEGAPAHPLDAARAGPRPRSARRWGCARARSKGASSPTPIASWRARPTSRSSSAPSRRWTGGSRGRGKGAIRRCRSRRAYEALILASIIEKETGRAGERPAIASVFVNRLRMGMRLQTDPTVIYGLGEALRRQPAKARPAGRHALEHLDRDGLPPTPIAMPGAASIEAATQSRRHRVPLFRRQGRRLAPVLAYPRGAQPGGGKIPAGKIMTTARFITVEGIDGAGKSSHLEFLAVAHPRARRRGRAHPRAGRHAPGREAARARPARADGRDHRGARHVRGAARAPRAGDRAGARARRLGRLRPLQRRDLRLPVRRPGPGPRRLPRPRGAGAPGSPARRDLPLRPRARDRPASASARRAARPTSSSARRASSSGACATPTSSARARRRRAST